MNIRALCNKAALLFMLCTAIPGMASQEEGPEVQDEAGGTLPEGSALVSGENSDALIRDEKGDLSYIVQLNESNLDRFSNVFAPTKSFQSYHKGTAVNLVKSVAADYGIDIGSMTSWTVVGFTAFLTEEQVSALRKDSRVVDISLNEKVVTSVDTTAVWKDVPAHLELYFQRVNQSTEIQSWGKRAVNQTTTNSSGSSVVYVVDVGVGQHEDLNVVEWVNADDPDTWHCGTRPGISCITSNTGGAVPNMPGAVGCNPHATAVSGIIGARSNSKGVVGINPGVKIVSVSFSKPGVSPTYSCDYNDSLDASKVGAALDWVKQDIINHPSAKLSVVNISANGSSFVTTIAAKIKSLATPDTSAGHPGAFVVESAGNQFSNACSYAYPTTSTQDGIMVVGAINNHGQPVVPLNGSPGFWKSVNENYAEGALAHEPGSNYGSCVEAWAPGDAIFTTFGPVSRQRSDTTYATYAYGSGTSFAAPHIAGLASYLIENNSFADPKAVEQNIRNRFSNLGSTQPATSAFPPATQNFYNTRNGAINLPTMNPLAAGVAKNTPYAEFVGGSKCIVPKWYTGTVPGACDKLDYTLFANIFPFKQISLGPLVVVSYMAHNGGALSDPGDGSLWLSFDSYGSGAYTCNVTTEDAMGVNYAVTHSGGQRYYDAGSAFYRTYVNSSCSSASLRP